MSEEQEGLFTIQEVVDEYLRPAREQTELRRREAEVRWLERYTRHSRESAIQQLEEDCKTMSTPGYLRRYLDGPKIEVPQTRPFPLLAHGETTTTTASTGRLTAQDLLDLAALLPEQAWVEHYQRQAGLPQALLEELQPASVPLWHQYLQADPKWIAPHPIPFQVMISENTPVLARPTRHVARTRREHQRARRQHRAAFRRRKRGLA